jgi:hypothetical protein
MENIERYSFGDISFFLYPEARSPTPGPVNLEAEDIQAF